MRSEILKGRNQNGVKSSEKIVYGEANDIIRQIYKFSVTILATEACRLTAIS